MKRGGALQVKCSNHFGAKRRGLLKVIIVLAPKGAIQNYIKNIRYDNCNFI
jgi:hypothetical protein